ncbi:MAG: hypothetical protein HY999_00020 [Nitrospinae bacterium]|nr:hypothetical protein [Nitrospinota bacterium]
MPENYLWINPSDADPLGIETGDMVKVTSPTSHITSPDGYIKIKAKVTELIRPGVVGISHHYGHWQLSSRPYKVGGNDQGYDPSRGTGAQPNEIMRIGEGMPSGYIATTLQERIGASCSFFDTRVNIQKI